MLTLFSTSTSIFAITNADSLTVVNLLNSAKQNTDSSNFANARKLVLKASAKSNAIGNIFLKANCLSTSALIEQRFGNFNESISLSKKALTLFKQINNQNRIAETLSFIALSYSEQNKYAEALECNYSALKIYEKLKDEKQIANTLTSISTIFWSQEKFDLALQILAKSTKILEKFNDKADLAYNYGNEALYYSSNHQTKKAIDKYNETIKICTDLNDKNCLASVYGNLGLLINDTGNWKLALNYQQKSIYFRKSISDINGLASSYCNVSQIYFENNFIDSSLYYANLGKELATETQSFEELEESTLLLSKIYEKKNDFRNALLNFKNYSSAHDSIYNAINTEKITRTQLNYEFEKQEQEEHNRELFIQKELIKNKAEFNLIFILLIAAVIILFFIIRDYRNKMKTNRELNLKNNLLVGLNREKDALTKIVAHDLKTPIAQVKGLSQLFEMLGSLNTEQKDVLEKVKISVEYGSNLIENLLNVNKLEDPEMPVLIKPVNIYNCITNALLVHNSSALIKEINIQINITFLGSLNTNEEHLNDIIENLVSNAIKFSKPLKSIFVNCYDDDANVYILIKDEAQGFNETDKKNLFGKYQKLSATPTGGERSTGLGLYIVKLLADKIGAQILLESSKNIGSTFTIVLQKK